MTDPCPRCGTAPDDTARYYAAEAEYDAQLRDGRPSPEVRHARGEAQARFLARTHCGEAHNLLAEWRKSRPDAEEPAEDSADDPAE